MQEADDLVILDGISLVSAWPVALAESLLADSTPWWGSWPGDPTDQPNQGSDYAQLANCVYAYCRYPKRVHLLRDPDVSIYSTQQLLDALYLELRFEHFGYGQIRRYEPRLRQAVQEVVQRVHSAHPPHFQAVTRLPHELIYAGTRVGVLTPYERRSAWVHCHFEADPTFAVILSLFEEAYQTTKDWDEHENLEGWQQAYAKVNALKLTVLRTDGKRGALAHFRVHEHTAAIKFEQPVLC
jgi:hypothetical protein